MKIKRYKKVSRRLSFYINNFGFRQPYQLLIDGTFCMAALKNKINIADNVPRYLQSELKLITTQCALIETEKLGHKVSGATVILKQYILHRCGHEGNPISGAKCLISMVGTKNENHYIIATQDLDLQKQLRLIPGVPLLYLHSRAPVFDNPSDASVEYVRMHASGLSMEEKTNINHMKKAEGIELENQNSIRKRKKVKGPNPLSCKKKKKTLVPSINVKASVGSKCRRRKIQIPQHVKEALYNNVKKLVENANE